MFADKHTKKTEQTFSVMHKVVQCMVKEKNIYYFHCTKLVNISSSLRKVFSITQLLINLFTADCILHDK
jgi:hypothetical protein